MGIEIRVSPSLTIMLESLHLSKRNDTLLKLWRKIKEETERKKTPAPATVHETTAPRRAPYSFD
jgi:hypothetical protein